MRLCISVKLSPPGTRNVDGARCTAVHSGFFISADSFSPVHSPKSHSSRPLSTTARLPSARAIGAARGLPVKVDRGLLECDFGEWTGRPLKELAKEPAWRTVQRYPSGFRFPGGESFTEMSARITGALQRLVERHESGVVVAVSHADPIKAAVADALGTHLDLFQRINVSPCSVTAVHYGPAGPAVLAVNSVEPLSSLVPS